MERVKQVHDEAQEKYYHILENHQNPDVVEKTQNICRSLGDKIDDMLLQNQFENEDVTSISHQMKSEIKVNYDMNSLMKSEFIYDIDPDLTNDEVSDTVFLQDQRKRAESKLIKLSIIYSHYNGE